MEQAEKQEANVTSNSPSSTAQADPARRSPPPRPPPAAASDGACSRGGRSASLRRRRNSHHGPARAPGPCVFRSRSPARAGPPGRSVPEWPRPGSVVEAAGVDLNDAVGDEEHEQAPHRRGAHGGDNGRLRDRLAVRRGARGRGGGVGGGGEEAAAAAVGKCARDLCGSARGGRGERTGEGEGMRCLQKSADERHIRGTY